MKSNIDKLSRVLFCFRFYPQIATMDRIINQFLKKTPVMLLDKYRRHTHEVLHVIFKTLMGAICNSPHSNTQWSEDIVIVTGSVAEGASLARLFSPDSDTSGEFEADVMCSFWMIPIEEQLLDYIHSNNSTRSLLM